MMELKNNRMEFHRNPDWQNPDVPAVNRLPAHSRWGAYATEEEAVSCRYGSSPYTVSLNGTYRFRLYSSPEEVDDFYRPDYDDSAFSDIAVPSCWETEGFGEPFYTNVAYPFSGSEASCWIRPNAEGKRVVNPPFAPCKNNPTGCYRKVFTLPENFSGREVYLSFEGVEAAFYLWVNGQPVGYAEDSKLTSDFCITDSVKPGENLLALEVIRFADSTYMEDQDYWFLSGIYRNVWMIAKSKEHIEDVHWTAIPDLHTKSGDFSADIRVSRVDGYADCTVKVSLYNNKRELLTSGEAGVRALAEYNDDNVPTANTARVKLSLPEVSLWSPESPVLYTAVFQLISPEGTVLDIESSRFGFKLLEQRSGVVYLNGRRLIIRGVNRHEHYYKTGRTVSKEHMLEEIRQMKRMNINSVRTCHYPDSPDWYDLCDEYGILLICECNIETHGVLGTLTHSPRWATAFLDRGVRMVEQHKNHVSIYSWSLGNESGKGPNHAAMYGFIKEYDPTRLCQYERAESNCRMSDVRGNMYAHPVQILQMLSDTQDTRPMILVEFLYQIRNSGGGMNRFWEFTRQYERFQGGYIWDWQDKCLCGKSPDGKPFFAYGGDFQESFVEGRDGGSDPSFMTCNGIVQPDLRWKPVAYEIKAVYCPVQIAKPLSSSAWDTVDPYDLFVLHNECLAEPLSRFFCIAALRENGVKIAEQEIPLPDLPAGKTQNMNISIPHEKKPGCLYTIEFSMRRKEGTFYSEAGEEIGLFQFDLESGPAENPVPVVCAAPSLTETENEICLAANGTELCLSKQTGTLLHVSKNGISYLTGGFTPCFDRPYTGLDANPRWGWYEEYQKIRRLSFACQEPQILSGKQQIRVEIPFAQQDSSVPAADGMIIYTLRGDGVLSVSADFHLDRSYHAVPRVGLEGIVAPGFEKLSYFGRGEVENYSDRIVSAPLGVYESTVAAQHFPFVPPAENGGHEETRWLRLGNDAGSSISVKSRQPLHFDAHHYTIADYRQAAHDYELTERAETILHLDAAHAPIGGNMAWSTAMPKEFEVTGGDYHMEFEISLK